MKKVIIYSVLLVVSFAFFIFILNLLKPEGILSKIKLTNTTRKETSAEIIEKEKKISDFIAKLNEESGIVMPMLSRCIFLDVEISGNDAKSREFYTKWIPIKREFDKARKALNKSEFETGKQIFIEVYKDELRDDEKAILGMPEDIPKTKRPTEEERHHLLDKYF